MAYGAETDEAVDHLFPEYDGPAGRHDNLAIRELPHLARPLIERIHDIQPQAVIAGDRGARLLAVTAVKSWRRRYPGEQFPTLTGDIRMARITSRSASEAVVREAAAAAFNGAGLDLYMQEAGHRDGNSPKVVYLDDWAVHGGTIKRFIEAARAYGLPASSITYLTMCGRKMKLPANARHFVGAPDRDPRWSEWDTYDSDASDTAIGVRYGRSAQPIVDRNERALRARQIIDRSVNNYYREFTATTPTDVAPAPRAGAKFWPLLLGR